MFTGKELHIWEQATETTFCELGNVLDTSNCQGEVDLGMQVWTVSVTYGARSRVSKRSNQ